MPSSRLQAPMSPQAASCGLPCSPREQAAGSHVPLAAGCRIPCPPGSRLQDPMVHRKLLPTQTTPSSTCPSDPKMRGAPGPSARPEQTRGFMVSGQKLSCCALHQQLGQRLGHQALQARLHSWAGTAVLQASAIPCTGLELPGEDAPG